MWSVIAELIKAIKIYHQKYRLDTSENDVVKHLIDGTGIQKNLPK